MNNLSLYSGGSVQNWLIGLISGQTNGIGQSRLHIFLFLNYSGDPGSALLKVKILNCCMQSHDFTNFRNLVFS